MARLSLTFEQLKEISEKKNITYKEHDETGHVYIKVDNFRSTSELAENTLPLFSKISEVLANLPKRD